MVCANQDIQKKATNLSKETRESAEKIIAGSDEHLDGLLKVITPLKDVLQDFKEFNELLENMFNSFRKEFVENELLPKLIKLKRSCVYLIGAVASNVDPEEIPSTFNELMNQYDVLSELIYDFKHYQAQEDSEMDNLMKDIENL